MYPAGRWESAGNACSCRPFSRHFTGARRGVCAASIFLYLAASLTRFLLNHHHFPNEPVCGQQALTTFPVFGFCCFFPVAPFSPCHCKGGGNPSAACAIVFPSPIRCGQLPPPPLHGLVSLFAPLSHGAEATRDIFGHSAHDFR